MNYINYQIHKILWSKYKFLVTLSIYLIYIYISNLNILTLSYCEEEQNINTTSTMTTKLLGYGLFLGSIALILFLQSLNTNSTSDISPLIDKSVEFAKHGALLDMPEFLDTFSLDHNGNLFIGDVHVSTDNVYLNAEQVKHYFELNKAHKFDTFVHPLKEWYAINNFPGIEKLPEAFMRDHIIILNQICATGNEQMLLNAQNSHLLIALEKVGIIPSNMFNVYANFLQNGGNPENFYQHLIQNFSSPR